MSKPARTILLFPLFVILLSIQVGWQYRKHQQAKEAEGLRTDQPADFQTTSLSADFISGLSLWLCSP